MMESSVYVLNAICFDGFEYDSSGNGRLCLSGL